MQFAEQNGILNLEQLEDRAEDWTSSWDRKLKKEIWKNLKNVAPLEESPKESPKKQS